MTPFLSVCLFHVAFVAVVKAFRFSENFSLAGAFQLWEKIPQTKPFQTAMEERPVDAPRRKLTWMAEMKAYQVAGEKEQGVQVVNAKEEVVLAVISMEVGWKLVGQLGYSNRKTSNWGEAVFLEDAANPCLSMEVVA